VPVATSTTVALASLDDVFGVALPSGYALADAPAAVRTTVRQELQTPEGATVLRDVDLKVVQRAGATVGVVTVFLLKPDQPQFSIIRGYADSRPRSSLTATDVAGKRVTLITWGGSARTAYAGSTSEIVVIVEMGSKSGLDAVAPALLTPI
jgi:hypothetical protein